MRRYELASGRGVARSLDSLLKLRRKATRSDQADLDQIPIVVDEISSYQQDEDAMSAIGEVYGELESSLSFAAAEAGDQPAAEMENAIIEAGSISVDPGIASQADEPVERQTGTANGYSMDRTDEPIARQHPEAEMENAMIEAKFDHASGTDESSAMRTIDAGAAAARQHPGAEPENETNRVNPSPPSQQKSSARRIFEDALRCKFPHLTFDDARLDLEWRRWVEVNFPTRW